MPSEKSQERLKRAERAMINRTGDHYGNPIARVRYAEENAKDIAEEATRDAARAGREAPSNPGTINDDITMAKARGKLAKIWGEDARKYAGLARARARILRKR